MVLHVDIREILALAWNNPLYTSGLVLLFTPPVFRVIIFFYPLLISTALCAVALVSVGHQIETSREREIAGWNAKVVDGDGLVSRLGSATGPRENIPGEDAWLKFVQDFQPSRSASNNDTARSNWTNLNNKHEGLMKHQFRVDDGRMVYMDDQDLLDRQIEAFRQYERNFSAKTRAEAKVAAAIAAASNGSTSLRTSASPPTPTISVPDKRDSSCDVTAPNVAPVFLYNWRSGGTGTAGKDTNRTKPEALSSGVSGVLASSGSSSSPSKNTISISEKSDSHCGAPVDSSEGSSLGIRSSSTKMISVPEKRGTDSAAPTKIPPMLLYNLRTGGTGTAGKLATEKAGELLSSSGGPAAVTDSQEKACIAGALPNDSIDNVSRNVNVVASSLGTQRGIQPPLPVPPQSQSRSVFETGTNAKTPAAGMEGSPVVPVKNLNHSASSKTVPWPALAKPHCRSEGQKEGFTKTFRGMEKGSRETNVFSQRGRAVISSDVASIETRAQERHRSPTGKVSLKRLFAPLGPKIDSSKEASMFSSPAKPVDNRRARNSNSTSRPGNAVIYSAGYDSSAVPSTRKICRSAQRK